MKLAHPWIYAYASLSLTTFLKVKVFMKVCEADNKVAISNIDDNLHLLTAQMKHMTSWPCGVDNVNPMRYLHTLVIGDSVHINKQAKTNKTILRHINMRVSIQFSNARELIIVLERSRTKGLVDCNWCISCFSATKQYKHKLYKKSIASYYSGPAC